MTSEHAAARSDTSGPEERHFCECYACHGTGVFPQTEPDADPEPCLACRESGYVSEEQAFRVFRFGVLARRVAERTLGLEPGSPPLGIPEGGAFPVPRPDEETELKLWDIIGQVQSQLQPLPRNVVEAMCDLCNVPKPDRRVSELARICISPGTVRTTGGA